MIIYEKVVSLFSIILFYLVVDMPMIFVHKPLMVYAIYISISYFYHTFRFCYNPSSNVVGIYKVGEISVQNYSFPISINFYYLNNFLIIKDMK